MTEPVTLLAPLVPDEVDLRGLNWMPLDVLRLLDSDLFALSTGDQFKAAVALWCKSWHQSPGGSLPDNDKVLAHLAGLGKDEAVWNAVKDVAMRNWVKCTDGRLYHPVVAEAAIQAWAERLRYMDKRERDAERLRVWREKERKEGNLGKQGGKRNVPRGTETREARKVKHVSSALRNASERAMSQRDRTGTGTGTGTKSFISTHDTYSPEFEVCWAVYPKRAGGNPKRDAWQAWSARLKEGVPVEDLAGGVKRYAPYCVAMAKVGTEFVLQAATFFGPSRRFAEAWDIPPNAPGLAGKPAPIASKDFKSGVNANGEF